MVEPEHEALWPLGPWQWVCQGSLDYPFRCSVKLVLAEFYRKKETQGPVPFRRSCVPAARMEDKPVVRLGRPVVLLVLGAHWTACLLFTLGGFRPLPGKVAELSGFAR